MIRPVLLGAWGNGFPYGVTSHLDWVSNVGYQFLHFHYNPAHMLAVTFFFTTTMFLGLHAGLILSTVNPSQKERAGEGDRARERLLPRLHLLFRRRLRPTSTGRVLRHQRRVLERGVHHLERTVLDRRLAVLVQLVPGDPDQKRRGLLRSDRWPISTTLYTKVQVRGPFDPGVAPLWRSESRFGKTFFSFWLGAIGDPQVGPFYLGWEGVISIVLGVSAFEIIGLNMWAQVNWDPISFIRLLPFPDARPARPPKFGPLAGRAAARRAAGGSSPVSC